jgi:HlyD family secretion protein
VEVGEAVVPGAPVLTLVPANGLWFGLSLREDALRGLTIGSSVPLHAAGQGKPISAKVVELRDWGEFAVWRAARAAGDHDLNTFFVRLDPVGPTQDMAAGQTVWLDPMVGGR